MVSLQQWAENTVEEYKKMAAELGATAPAFYTQSNLLKLEGRPEVMVLGINPGSDGTYAAQQTNEAWGLNGQPMDGAHLLQGNPFWNDRHSWAYWQRLRRLFDDGDNPLDDERRFVMTNASFFATPKANNLSPALLRRTLPFTLELIDLLRPRLIVVLSGKERMKTMANLTDGRLTYAPLFRSYDDLLVGELAGIPCCGIPHPSASLLREERELLRQVLARLRKGEDIAEEAYADLLQVIRRRKRQSHLSAAVAAQLFTALAERMKALPCRCYESTPKLRRYDLGNGLQLTLVNGSNNRFVAVRQLAYKGPLDVDRLPIARAQEVSDCLKKAGYVYSPVWLGMKDFNRLVVDSVDDTADRLAEEIAKLVADLRRILPPASAENTASAGTSPRTL